MKKSGWKKVSISAGKRESISALKREQKGRKETARNLLLLNVLTEEQIAQAANLSIEEVRQLKQGKEGGH